MATAMIEGRMIPDAQFKIAELNEVRAAFKTAVSKSGHLAAIVASSGDAIISIELDGRVRSWNHGAERLFGYTAEDMIGHPKNRIIPDARLGELQRHLEVVRAGENLRTETVRKTRDGTLIDVSLDMAPIRDSDGKIVAMSSIIHDITSRKNTEKHQRFLMRELTHRTKNLLAIVQSMARQTARSAASLKDFETEYMQRLQGIAASHDLLVNQNWAGAPLDELIRRQVEPFVETNRANLAISGPDIIITAKAAQTIGLALHELATNSMKYGALSTPKGKVSIDWEFHQTGEEPQRLRLKWEEHNGPPVTPPTRQGFGHFVIDRMATQSLAAKVDIDFRPEGLVWVIDAPTQALQTEPEFDAGNGAGA
jgi:PAS domain S-box-containing protein